MPWHSTISRTRQLYGEEVFLILFQEVLKHCVSKGMVRGRRQCVDSAFIKANASMDSLLEKEVIEDCKAYVSELTENSSYHRQLVKRRSGTVEPVLGTLMNHYSMRRLNTRGLKQANKHVLMSALCYNLKKYLKFTQRTTKIYPQSMDLREIVPQSVNLTFMDLHNLEIRAINLN